MVIDCGRPVEDGEIENVRIVNRNAESENQPRNEGADSALVPNENEKQFFDLMETIHNTELSLQNISTLCNPIDGDPHVNPEAHETDINVLNLNCEHIRNQVYSFNQSVSDYNNGFPIQLAFLLEMERIHQGDELYAIRSQLQNVVYRADSGSVRRYGELAKSILQEIRQFKHELEKNTKLEAENERKDKENRRKMLELRAEMEEFTMKMEKMEKEHAEEKAKADKKHEDARREGEQKITKMELDQEELKIKQQTQLELHLEREKKAENLHLEEMKKLNQTIRDQKFENEKLNREEIEKENAQRIQLININFKAVTHEIDVTVTNQIVRQFQEIMYPFSKVRESLESLKELRVDEKNSAMKTTTFSVNILREKEAFGSRVEDYKKSLKNKNVSDSLTEKMIVLMNHKDLHNLCTHLMDPIEKKDGNEFEKYRKMASKYCVQFLALEKEFQEEMQKWMTSTSCVDILQIEQNAAALQ